MSKLRVTLVLEKVKANGEVEAELRLGAFVQQPSREELARILADSIRLLPPDNGVIL